MATYQKLLVDSLNTTNLSTKSEDVYGIKSNTDSLFKKTITGKDSSIIDFISKKAPSGDFQKIEDINVLLNSIRNLLTTPVGSYPFDPTYGSDLYKMVFEISDEETIESIKFEVIDKIQQYDDRVKIIDVKTQFFNNTKGFRLSIVIEKGSYDSTLSLDFTSNGTYMLHEADDI